MATESVEYVILEPQAPCYAHSTGPKTAEGKARSSMNALKRGLRSKKIVLPGEDAGEFADFRQALVDDLQPVGVEETALADTIAGLHWRMLRYDREEVDLMSSLPEKPVETLQMVLDPKTHMTRPVRTAQAAPRSSEPPTLAEALRANRHELALVLRYRSQTARELKQARAEYRTLQKERKERVAAEQQRRMLAARRERFAALKAQQVAAGQMTAEEAERLKEGVLAEQVKQVGWLAVGEVGEEEWLREEAGSKG